MTAPDSRRLQFGLFEIDCATGELRKGGIKIKLQDQPFQVVSALLDRPGQIVTREELRQKIWPADTFIDFDQSLNKAINKIREALGDSAENPRFVETVPRRGYRFIAPVNTHDQPEQPAITELSTPEQGSSSRFRRAATLAGAGCVLAAALIGWLHWPSTRARILRSVQITNDGRQKSLSASHPDIGDRTASLVSPSASASTGPTVQPLLGIAGTGLRILCGQRRPRNDRLGRLWSADQYFEGGNYWERPSQFLARTFDPSLFQDARIGDFSYHIPLTPGVYELHLYFAEPNVGSTTGLSELSRVFHVALNGKTILRDFDVISDAGGAGIVDERVFKDVSPAPNGILHIRFLSVKSQAMLSAIVVEPARLHRLNTARIFVHESPYTDSRRVTWMPDDFWIGGTIGGRFDFIKGMLDRELYSTQRFGNFSYAIPVDEGEYAVTLHFAESWWGRENDGGGGVGSRVFDVFCNGTALVRNLDIYREVGANRPLLKTFHRLKPNAQGKLLLSFVPVRNYALLNALEVEDESRE
jgi:DNA-binding winged helix-turn-helix (wHTH) protein